MGENCKKRLSMAGVADDLAEFVEDAVTLERDMNRALQQLGDTIQQARQGSEFLDAKTFISTAKELASHFGEWRFRTELLVERGAHAPTMTVTSQNLTIQCSYHNSKVDVEAGEEVTVIDSSQPNQLKVRTSRGQEGFVPTLTCLVAMPDKNPTTTSQRIQIQLLSTWLECLRKMKYLLLDTLYQTSYNITDQWKAGNNNNISIESMDKVMRRFKRVTKAASRPEKTVDFSRLHSNLARIEREMGRCKHTDSNKLVNEVQNLDQAVLCLQNYHTAFDEYRASLENGTVPIKLESQWPTRQSKRYSSLCKYFEVKVVLESVETREEVEYITDPDVISGGTGLSSLTVKADQLTSTSGETRMKIVIESVIDPRTGKEISFQDAIEQGIVIQSEGRYVNPATGEWKYIHDAMKQGQIKVEYTTEKKIEEKTTAMGLISIQTIKKDISYEVTGAVDPRTGEKVNLQEAKSRGLIDDDYTTYNLITKEQSLPIEEAVETGWVLAKYDTDTGEPVYETQTYAIKSVVDQYQKKKIPFEEAVSRGLVERDTATYFNNVTCEKIPVTVAIDKGFLKAEIVTDEAGLDIDTENRMVVNKIEDIKKSLVHPANALSALKKAASAKGT